MNSKNKNSKSLNNENHDSDLHLQNDLKKDPSLFKCCESGCEGCPFDFKKLDIDPNIPRELQLS